MHRLFLFLLAATLTLLGCSHSNVIPFERTPGGVLVVPAVLNLNPNIPNVHPPAKRLAIDTGTAHTSFFVSYLAVNDLSHLLRGGKVEERKTPSGAMVRVCHFAQGRVTVGKFSADIPIDATAYDTATEPAYDGVLGLDFISQFNVQFDFQANTMTLSPR